MRKILIILFVTILGTQISAQQKYVDSTKFTLSRYELVDTTLLKSMRFAFEKDPDPTYKKHDFWKISFWEYTNQNNNKQIRLSVWRDLIGINDTNGYGYFVCDGKMVIIKSSIVELMLGKIFLPTSEEKDFYYYTVDWLQMWKDNAPNESAIVDEYEDFRDTPSFEFYYENGIFRFDYLFIY